MSSFAGKVLRVDLSRGTAETQRIPEEESASPVGLPAPGPIDRRCWFYSYR